MSSATSIERGAMPQGSSPAPGSSEQPAASTPADAAFKPWHFFVLASLLAATAAVVMSRRATPEHLVLISVAIAAVGFAGAGFYRMIAPFALRETAMSAETLSERARATLEREKALALRSIKELEFDRAMGKVSDRDFEEMSGRLRARALMLMKQLDQGEGGYREIIERELNARLAGRALDPQRSAPVDVPEDDAPAACAGCGTVNDGDASFCKRCGARLGDTETGA